MNDADKKQLYNALSIIVNMEAQLTNMMGRSARAAKYWAEAGKKNTSMDEKQKQSLKAAIAGIAQLTKDAKVVLKDLNTCAKEAGNTAFLAKYPSGKEYRDKVVVKRLASAKAFDQNGGKFLLNLMNVLGSSMYPGMHEADPKVTVDSVKGFSSYYNKMRIELAKL
jgi:hypothetical protein